MAQLYLIIGETFDNHSDLVSLNEALFSCGLIADPIESEKKMRDQYTPGNIRRVSDPEGMSRFDYVRLTSDDFHSKIIIGRILSSACSSAGISHQYYPASASLDKIMGAMESLKEDLSDFKVHSVYAYSKDVKQNPQ